MAVYTYEFVSERKVWAFVEAENKKEAVDKIMRGEGCEVDWVGSDVPDDEDDIDDLTRLTKKEGEEYLDKVERIL